MAAYELSAPQATTTNTLDLDSNYSHCANEHECATITRQNDFRPFAEVHNNNQPFTCRNISSSVKVFNYIHLSLSSWGENERETHYYSRGRRTIKLCQPKAGSGVVPGPVMKTGRDFWLQGPHTLGITRKRMKKSGYYSLLWLRKGVFSKKKRRIIATKSEGVHSVYCAWSFGFRTSQTPRLVIKRNLQAFPRFFIHSMDRDFLGISDKSKNNCEISPRPAL